MEGVAQWPIRRARRCGWLAFALGAMGTLSAILSLSCVSASPRWHEDVDEWSCERRSAEATGTNDVASPLQVKPSRAEEGTANTVSCTFRRGGWTTSPCSYPSYMSKMEGMTLARPTTFSISQLLRVAHGFRQVCTTKLQQRLTEVGTLGNVSSSSHLQRNRVHQDMHY